MTPSTAGASLPKRVLAFAGLPFLSLVTPFLFLPLLARVAGPDAWLAIAVGQSVGAFGALFVALGYNTVGPTMVALAAAAERRELLIVSVRARTTILIPAGVLAVAIAVLVAPASHRLEAGLMSLAMVLTGLSSSWFMIGLGRAGLIVLYEILPRIVATLIAAAVLVLLGEVIWYPILLVLAALVSVIGFLLRTVPMRELVRADPGTVRRVLLANRSALVTEVAAGAYNSLAVTFVSLTASVAQAASYVSGDKLYRIGQYSVSALGNALQPWVVEEDRREFAHRVRRALVLHLSLGLAGLLGFAFLGSWLSGWLFGAAVAINETTALGFGVATLGIALGTALGRVTLVALGARREFMTSVLLGAGIGVPAILLLAAQFGSAGGAWGLALGEAVSVTCQAIFVLRRWPRAVPAPRVE
ncbi:polysaccharide biosynthesis protein [Leifsonia sp. H3M29-4]|uniref:polysaccharide biosynthesis protein n=1 Tax=Salinibacterium metalliresistens TaxID=3031321 RepID=UPI0023DCAD14|nr:polysaccharide biosynthesis protein [Salinibacterium metalliresistens]MDF1479172.1 polysaccharide biosynthesis protein [Salinibacterium metalliresistens]